MKLKKQLIFFVIICLCLVVTACATKQTQNSAENVMYTEDRVFGNGEKTIKLEVIKDDSSVTFTINTDAKNLEDALTEHKLIEGEKGAYGLYVKKVNGITADYNSTNSYWSLCQDGNPLQTGVGGIEIADGEHFEFVYTQAK